MAIDDFIVVTEETHQATDIVAVFTALHGARVVTINNLVAALAITHEAADVIGSLNRAGVIAVANKVVVLPFPHKSTYFRFSSDRHQQSA